MRSLVSKPIGYVGAFFACIVMALTTGCASGGFKLTRQYAGFVNKQMIIIRIVLYILTSIVFAATLLIDMVIFNTMDFWEGRVSAGDYNFNQGEKTFHVRHEVMPGTGLKRSTIQVYGKDKNLLQTVLLNQTADGGIEYFLDGKLRGKARDLGGLPVVASYDADGRLVSDKLIMTEVSLPAMRMAGR